MQVDYSQLPFLIIGAIHLTPIVGFFSAEYLEA